jgi:hypothetical protein
MGEKGMESGTGSAVGTGSSQLDPGSQNPSGPSGTGGGGGSSGPAGQALGGGGGGGSGTPPSSGGTPNTLQGALGELNRHNP